MELTDFKYHDTPVAGFEFNLKIREITIHLLDYDEDVKNYIPVKLHFTGVKNVIINYMEIENMADVDIMSAVITDVSETMKKIHFVILAGKIPMDLSFEYLTGVLIK